MSCTLRQRQELHINPRAKLELKRGLEKSVGGLKCYLTLGQGHVTCYKYKMENVLALMAAVLVVVGLFGRIVQHKRNAVSSAISG